LAWKHSLQPYILFGYVNHKNNTFHLCVCSNYIGTCKDHSSGVTAMLITYIVLALSGLIGSAIAWDDVKAAAQQD
jgi:hypothetical protein